MAHSHIVFRNPEHGTIKRAPVGFSWTTFLFGFWPALFRGDFKWFGWLFGIQFITLLLTYGIGTLLALIVFGFIYNRLYVKELLKAGYRVEKVESSKTLEQLQAELEAALPTL